jgi:23S rRNA pseudouridine1911/1915/1917 synthase
MGCRIDRRPEGDPRGKIAVMRYRVPGVCIQGILGWFRDAERELARMVCVTWLEVELETGRTHQIRVQSASRIHPVVGDAQYGSTRPFGEQFEDERLRAIALHARQLGFNHPMTNEPVDVIAPTPEAWETILPSHR